MKIRSAIFAAAAMLLGVAMAPGAIAADLTDVGYIDQADLANLPVFVNANGALAAYKAQLDAQFNAQVKRARSDAQRQQITMQFQQQYNDKQREIVGPLFQRAQLAIAAVAATRNLSIVVDKRIVIYGGQDVTKDVEAVFSSSQAIVPPSATPPPSEIGFVDQTVLDGVPKVQNRQQRDEAVRVDAAADLFREDGAGPQRQRQAADLPGVQQDAFPTSRTSCSSRSSIRRRPRRRTSRARRILLLVVDKADVIYGGTDITTDVQNELGK